MTQSARRRQSQAIDANVLKQLDTLAPVDGHHPVMASRSLLDVEVRYLDERGDWVPGPRADVDAAAAMQGRPVRTFPTQKGQRNYPGLFWSGTTGRVLAYESQRDRLWLADFDTSVTAIASQPFGICGRDGSARRRRVPDFPFRTDAGYVVVDSKLEPLLTDSGVAEVLDWVPPPRTAPCGDPPPRSPGGRGLATIR